MKGDDRVRFCASCKLSVYNLSRMSRAEAEQLVETQEGRLCVRFYRRQDGTVLTRDCPVGMLAIRKKLRRAGVIFAAALAVLSGICFALAQGNGEGLPRSLSDLLVMLRFKDPPPVMGMVK